ncbi:hypothetical protein BQ8482_110187 [Mesorhizobium delmotii]|uniref:Uncharacterized protein n=1 Tax=Mesorhizobium delmotii TaxID=1631247 RepID=A0A2P9AAZ4_9HYPH|nr:hypothetical protein BQ8482_110187 [Mesorhizobium delmotii]
MPTARDAANTSGTGYNYWSECVPGMAQMSSVASLAEVGPFEQCGAPARFECVGMDSSGATRGPPVAQHRGRRSS